MDTRAATALLPVHHEAPADQTAVLRSALHNPVAGPPLRERVRGDLVILVATGTHRGNSEAELRQMFGDETVDRVRIINHDARDPGQLTWMGRYGDRAGVHNTGPVLVTRVAP
ncbi:lactate racemase domain-containing protein [Streptomyces sp. NPDC050698]